MIEIAKLKRMAESISKNGFAPGHTGTVYAPVKMVADLLCENGRLDEGMKMLAQAGPDDVIRIRGGAMELIEVSDEA